MTEPRPRPRETSSPFFATHRVCQPLPDAVPSHSLSRLRRLLLPRLPLHLLLLLPLLLLLLARSQRSTSRVSPASLPRLSRVSPAALACREEQKRAAAVAERREGKYVCVCVLCVCVYVCVCDGRDGATLPADVVALRNRAILALLFATGRREVPRELAHGAAPPPSPPTPSSILEVWRMYT